MPCNGERLRFELSYWLWMLYKEKKHGCCTSQQKVPCVLDKTPKFRILMFGFSSKKPLIEIKLIHWDLHIQANLSTVMDSKVLQLSVILGEKENKLLYSARILQAAQR